MRKERATMEKIEKSKKETTKGKHGHCGSYERT
jgi:hypothetical protein